MRNILEVEMWPEDDAWCEGIDHENTSEAARPGGNPPDAKVEVRTLRFHLKRTAKRLRSERKRMTKISQVLEDQLAKLDQERVMLRGLSTTLPGQEFQLCLLGKS